MTATDPALPVRLDQEQLDRLHRVQLNIALEVKHICEKHGIDYFLFAGTLLGAVRHSGFIPWDDDLDIGMPRASYDKFLDVARQELGERYFLQTPESDPGYGLCFAKVRLNGTELVEISTTRTPAHNGIFVDIFPLDGVPDQKWKRRLHSPVVYALKRVVMLNRGYEPWHEAGRVEAWVYQIAAPPSRILPRTLLTRLLDRAVRLFNGEPTRLVAAFGGSYGYLKESLEREWTKHLEPIDFEGVTFSSLRNSEEYLTRLYGDYMTPPPPEARITKHGVTSVDFGGSVG